MEPLPIESYRPTSADRRLAREGVRIVARVKAEAESMDSFHRSRIDDVERKTPRRSCATIVFYSTSPLTRSIVSAMLKRLGWRCVAVSTVVDLGAEAKRAPSVAPLSVLLVDAMTDEHPREVLQIIRSLAPGIPAIVLTEVRNDGGKGFALIPKWREVKAATVVVEESASVSTSGKQPRQQYLGTLSQKEAYDLGFDIAYASCFTVSIASEITDLFLTVAGRSRDSILASSNHLKIRTLLSDVTDRFFSDEGPRHFEELGKKLELEHARILESLSAKAGVPVQPLKGKHSDKRAPPREPTPVPEPDLIDTHPTFVILQGKYEHTQQVLFNTQKELAKRNFQLSESEVRIKKIEEEKAIVEDNLEELRRSIEHATTNPQLAKERLEMMQRRAFDATRIKSLEGLLRNLRLKLDESDKLAADRLRTIETLKEEVVEAKEAYSRERAAMENMLAKLNEARDEEGRRAFAEAQRRDMELRFRRRETDALKEFVQRLQRRLECSEQNALRLIDVDATAAPPVEVFSPTRSVVEMKPLYRKAPSIVRKANTVDVAVQATLPHGTSVTPPPSMKASMSASRGTPQPGAGMMGSLGPHQLAALNAMDSGMLDEMAIPAMLPSAKPQQRDVALSPIRELIERSTNAALNALRMKGLGIDGPPSAAAAMQPNARRASVAFHQSSGGSQAAAPQQNGDNASRSRRASVAPLRRVESRGEVGLELLSPVSVKSEGTDRDDLHASTDTARVASKPTFDEGPNPRSRRQSKHGRGTGQGDERKSPPVDGSASPQKGGSRPTSRGRSPDADAAFGRFRIRSNSTAYDAPFLDPTDGMRPMTPRESWMVRDGTRKENISSRGSARAVATDRQSVTASQSNSAFPGGPPKKQQPNWHAKYNPNAREGTNAVIEGPDTALSAAATTYDVDSLTQNTVGTLETTYGHLMKSLREEAETDIGTLSSILKHLSDVALLRTKPYTKKYLFALQARMSALGETMDEFLLNLPSDMKELQSRAEHYFALFQERRWVKAAIDEVSKATSGMGVKELETLMRRRANVVRRIDEMATIFISQGDFMSYSELKADLVDIDAQVARWLATDERHEQLGTASCAESSHAFAELIDSIGDAKTGAMLSEINDETMYHVNDLLLTVVRKAALAVGATLLDKRRELAPGRRPLYPQPPNSLHATIEDEAADLLRSHPEDFQNLPLDQRFGAALDRLRADREATMRPLQLVTASATRVTGKVMQFATRTKDCIQEYERREEVTKNDLKKRGVDLRLFNEAVDLKFLQKLQSPSGYAEVTPATITELFEVHHKHLKRLLRFVKERSPLANVKIVDAALQERTIRIEMTGGEAKAASALNPINVPFVLAADTALVARFADYYQEETEGQFRTNRAKYKKYCETLSIDEECQTDAVRLMTAESDVRGRSQTAQQRLESNFDGPTDSPRAPTAYSLVFGHKGQVAVTTVGGADHAFMPHLPTAPGRVVLPGRKIALGSKLATSTTATARARGKINVEATTTASRVATAESRANIRERAETAGFMMTVNDVQQDDPAFGSPKTARTPTLPEISVRTTSTKHRHQ